MAGPGALGPAPITERPIGLLDLLAIKNGGQYPQHLASDWLLPTFDLFDWYAQFQSETLKFTPSVLGNIASMQSVTTVDQAEVWWLHDVAFRSTSAFAGTLTQFGVELWVGDSSNLAVSPLAQTPIYTPATSFRLLYMQTFARPRLLLPGSPISIGAFAFAGTAAPTIDVYMRVTRAKA